jgi:large subunit ribosomal protein L9
MMQIILLERVEKLGQMGDVVTVKPGFARNFLLPKKKALRATKVNLEFFEQQRSQLEATNLKRRDEAQGVAGKIDGIEVVLLRQAGDTGQLYGSVTNRDIAQEALNAGITVERGQVRLDQPIKTLGLFPVRVVLHPEVWVTITVNIARSLEDANLQRSRGTMVTAAQLAEEETAALSKEDAPE